MLAFHPLGVPKVSSSMPLSAFNPVGSWSDISGSMRSNGCEVWKCDRGGMRVWVERRVKFLSCENTEERNSDMEKASLRARRGYMHNACRRMWRATSSQVGLLRNP